MSAVPTWSGRRAATARQTMADLTTWPTTCARCNDPVVRTDRWVVGHRIARAVRPDLTWELSNWQVECRACSDASSQSAVIERAHALGAAGLPLPTHPRTAPPRPISLPGASEDQPEPRSELLWRPESLAAFPWLLPYLGVPDDASPPLWMSPPPESAVGSYGEEAIAWIERAEGKTLRWWQRLAIVRQLEHDAAGVLVHRTVVESAPRRSGKSTRLRGVALWRMAVGRTLFGERQEVVHTGSDLAVCRKVQKDAWRWCQAQEWTVTRGNGKEAVEAPEGDSWLVRAQDAVYGWDTTLALVDEGWDVRPDTVTEGLEPSLLERSSPQLHLTSTAHRRATSLMRSRIASALSTDDPRVLVLVWAAPAGADYGSEETWRAASPHWSEDRRQMIADKYAAAMAGQADPEADDPDPMSAFLSQYLNVWRLRERREPPGVPLVSAEAWEALAGESNDSLVPDGTPDAAAIESWFDAGLTLVLAYRDGDQVQVRSSAHLELADAVADLKASGFRGITQAGASLLGDPALRGLRVEKVSTRATVAVGDLARLLAEDVVRHDGDDHLAEQVLAVRTQPAADGLRLVSKGRADAIKATVWAVQGARKRRGSVRVLLPTGS